MIKKIINKIAMLFRSEDPIAYESERVKTYAIAQEWLRKPNM